ncbi:uncharacterized protein PgNI_00034 [Pyricularia grisea]|uniref:Uncharacterized protein n=1 Tax=Pyricularia grisea TaxID=148305 RepID=A0A6P8BJJ2_PYRGI|nr:uncharacterized protein PgNI_00034 [Pyricularia grisea]TLD16860.1 hypothetical protein PgNI_00034 [Pyricularia grisea]
MKFTVIASTLMLAAGVCAEAVLGANGNCQFPNGPDCVANGKKNGQGQREFQEPADSPGDDCYLFPASCGNGDGVAVFPCVKVGGRAAPKANKTKAKAKNARRGAALDEW